MHDINLIHYTKLSERLPVILKEFENSIFKLKTVHQFDKEDLSKEDLKKFDTNYMSRGEISCFMKHVHVYEELVKSSEKDFSIVIEDDILLENNFDNKMKKLLKKLPNNFHFIFFGSSKLNMHIPTYKRRPFKNLYKKTNIPTTWGGNGMTKTTDSYIISKEGAQKVLDRAKKIDILDDAFDFWLNQSARDLNLNGYWYEPTFTKYNIQFESNLATQYKDVPSKN